METNTNPEVRVMTVNRNAEFQLPDALLAAIKLIGPIHTREDFERVYGPIAKISKVKA